MKKTLLALVITVILSGCTSGKPETGNPEPSGIEPVSNKGFSLGWYSSLKTEDLEGIKQTGGNFAITYILSGRLEDSEIQTYLDEANKRGIKVLLDVTADWKWFDNDMPKPAFTIGDWQWSFDYAYQNVNIPQITDKKQASHHGGWDKKGINQHGFYMDYTGYPVLNIQPHDVFEVMVYIPSDSTVKELMLEFYAAKKDESAFAWKYRVYWGEDLFPRKEYEKNLPAIRAGNIPKERDQWVKVSFNVDNIDLDETVVRGINFVNAGSQVYWDLPTRRTSRERLAERIRKFSNHPALYGWYLCDEPELRNIDPDRLKDIHDIVREFDPNPEHKLEAVFQDWKVLQVYSKACDEIFIDCYPVEVTRRNLNWMTQWVSKAVKIARNQQKNFVFVPQAFGDIKSYPTWTIPTEYEFRWMTWTPIIMGARGICYWAYYVAPQKLIDESKKLFAEIKKYEPYFFEGVPVTGLNCNIQTDSDNDTNPDVIYSAFDYKGKRLVLLSNTTGKQIKGVKVTGSEFVYQINMDPYEVVIAEVGL